jgi:anthranilate phosphoribosyltransferase
MKELLAQLIHGTALTSAQAESAFTDIMEGTADPVHTASLLSLLAAREPTVEELEGAATVMRRHVVAIDAPENVIDTCGTGGTGSPYFNISTTVALVAAAAGVPVCKHGNRSVTSRSGSSDVLRELGVNIETTPAQEARCLREARMCFAFAPRHHPAMKHVAPIRQALGFATIFNLLGPLTNPAGARRQVVGTRSGALADKLLEVLVRLGAARAMVVSGSDPRIGALCDISVTGPTHMADFDGVMEDGPANGTSGGGVKRRYSIMPADLGLTTHEHSEELEIRSAEDSARLVRAILARQVGGAVRDIVLANAAAALWVGGGAANLKEGVARASEALDSGGAERVLGRLVACSHEAA